MGRALAAKYAVAPASRQAPPVPAALGARRRAALPDGCGQGSRELQPGCFIRQAASCRNYFIK